MNIEFFTHNMSLSGFANECERKPDTIADWRKRGMIKNYGQPHPNRDGRWLYSREDVMAVYIAAMLQERAGLTWAGALDAGMQLTESILTLASNGIAPSGIAYIFELPGGMEVCVNSTAEDAFNVAQPHVGALIVARAVKLESIINHLPGGIQEAVWMMKDAA